jgi:long-subunit fatty acid transport protein
MSFIDSLGLNQMNYALWTKYERTTVSLGFNYAVLTTRSEFAGVSSSDANLRGGFLAVPLMKKKVVFGMGLMPVFINNFAIELTQLGPDNTTTQRVEAKGNITEVVALLSTALSDRLSLAVNGGYDFGIITDKLSILYNNAAYSDITVYDEFQTRGVNFGLSAFYQMKGRLSLGMKYKSRTNCSVNTERNSINLSGTIKGTKTVVLPSLAAFGMNYKLNRNWQVGFDVVYQDWEKLYRIDEEKNERINGSYRFGMGVEKSPVDRRFVPYLQEISWRGGFFISQMNVTVENNPVMEYGIAAGFGLPLRKNRNRIDISLEYGIRETTGATMLRENIFSVSVALLNSEVWFTREKR